MLTISEISTTTRTPCSPLLVINRLSRQKIIKDIEGLRAKIVRLCNGSLYPKFENMSSFQAHIERLK